jgi:hypothetical protein
MPEIVFSGKASENTYSFAERKPPEGIAKARNRRPASDKTGDGCQFPLFQKRQ